MKKRGILLLAVALILALLAGCTTTPTTAGSTTTAATTTAAGTTAATTTAATSETELQVIDITALIPESATEFLKADSTTYKKLQEILLDKFKINYSINTAMATEMATTVNMLFASKQMPDIVDHSLSASDMDNLFRQGLILPLNDLIDANAPTVKQTFEENPLFYVAHGNSDGEILRLPSNFTFNPQHRIRMLHINLVWLDKLSLPIPETTEAFYDTLKAFKDNDMNNDGKNNEVLTAYNTPSLGDPIAPAFGAKWWWNASSSYYYDADGTIYHEFVQPSALEFLTYMNKLYEEGLLDNDYTGQTTEAYNEKMYTGRIAAFADHFWGSAVASTAARANGIDDAEYIQVPPLVTDIGNQKQVYRRDATGYGGWMITSNCAYPERAINIAEFGYTNEGSQIVYYGEASPGGKYYRDPTAEEIADVGLEPPVYLMQYTEEGQKRHFDESLSVFWSKEGFNASLIPFQLVSRDASALVWSNYPNRGKYRLAEKDHILSVLNKGINEYAIDAIRFMTATPEQNSVLEEKAELFVYMDEMIDKFVTGNEPLSNWDAYVAKCNELGLAEVLEVMQARYEAYLAVVS
ncbi:MAG: hypothetical protein SCM11_15315 [Bacillota bacterium]|nr:hypothetical protein [Bacillota bacterium]